MFNPPSRPQFLTFIGLRVQTHFPKCDILCMMSSDLPMEGDAVRSLDNLDLDEREKEAIRAASRILRKNFPVEEVLLFGSKTRNEADPESDIDLLVLTTRPISWPERKALVAELYEVELANDVVLSPFIIPTSEWYKGSLSVLPIHEEVLRDGITV